MAVALGLPATALQPGRHRSSASRTTAHSASVMSDGYRRTRPGRSAAFPNRCASQSHNDTRELDAGNETA
ncbi:hypothetical protein [Streptomyces sp. A1547]|uniref:hypothetical protein n=1 Tax=Streptomyces sp. A1547 TaxID=2563105 RepID=UPI001F0DEE30|nr:hypothetical protein [Streptomyces sp. A1547]